MGSLDETFDVLKARLHEMPAIAILRGLPTNDAVDVVQALFEAGIRVAEVPLNSPDPFDTIALLVRTFGDRMSIGAGTVLTVADVERLAAIGCRVCVSPNTNVDVIRASVRHAMVPLPGFATPSEAFAAIDAGARMLKAFPSGDAERLLPALRAVLPKDVQVVAVGGVTPMAAPSLFAAGADAFGIGSDLYKPGRSAQDVGARAREWVAAIARGRRAVARLSCNPEATIGESPVVADDGEVLWVDPTVPRLLRWDGRECRSIALREPVWSLARVPDGSIVGNGETHLVRFARDMATLKDGEEVDVGAGCRLNDMTVDSRGGIWAGTMHRGVLGGRGALFHAPAWDAPVRRVAEGLGAANGMAFSRDERTLFVIDTLARTLLAYPADVAAGTLGEPTIVTDFLGLPGKPDGLAIDAHGRVWVAMWGGGCIVRLADNGACVETIPVPAPHVGSLCFDEAGTCFVTTARARLSPHALVAHPGAGGLFTIEALG
ncbi:Entner-Doudoroff aldolase [Lysobacter sp. OAE881]|uniref:2-dehydro-3-deoxy-6-phosphogalactonate aldolase n=1 Tax=Lysobacter sp. OAE881 TaxID=2663813 RepID=UPI00178B0848